MATFGDPRLGREAADGTKRPLVNTATTLQAKAVLGLKVKPGRATAILI